MCSEDDGRGNRKGEEGEAAGRDGEGSAREARTRFVFPLVTNWFFNIHLTSKIFNEGEHVSITKQHMIDYIVLCIYITLKYH